MSIPVDVVASGAARRGRDQDAWGSSGGYEDESPKSYSTVHPESRSIVRKTSKRASMFAGRNKRPRAEFMHLLDTLESAGLKDSPPPLLRYMAAVKALYESFPIQFIIALLILTAFGIEVWDTEAFPEEGSKERGIIDIMDHLLTWIFVGELGINFFANMFWPFFENPWNWFDLAVVSISVLHLFLSGLPWLGALRLARTFRVVRLFGRFQGFRRIIHALGSAMVPVVDAFIIVLIMMAVFAILGVSLFNEQAPEYFGTFTNALFTMFTITTVDGWVDVVNVAAPGVYDWGKLYFVAYIIVLVWTLLPVVIAVLLDKFTETMSRDREVIRRARIAVQAVETMTASPLDPILRTLTDFETDEDLSQRIRLLYKTLDVDGQGSLTHESVVAALKKLVMGRDVSISQGAWDELTQNERLCDAEGGLSLSVFESIVRTELRNYLQRDLAGELRMAEENSFSIPILSGLKLLLLHGESDGRDRGGSSRGPSRAGSRPGSRRVSVAAISHYVDKVDALTRQLASERAAKQNPPGLAQQVSSGLLAKRDSAPGMAGMMQQQQQPGQGSEPLAIVAHGGPGERLGAEAANAVRRIEGMLDSVLRGQERLEEEMAKLRRGQGEITQAVNEIRQAQGGGAGECCDVCLGDTNRVGPSFRVGRARMCQTCAGLVAVGHGAH